MKYSIKEIKILELIDWIVKDKINLHPPYQRNFIWSPKDQRLLIDSIRMGYPLPNFFIYKNGDGKYDMVDGQQRATTISKYVKNEFPDSSKSYYKDIDKEKFISYILNITEIYDVDTSKGESLESFYSLVNKRGVHLNPAEVNKAQYYNAPFMVLVNSLMDLQELTELDIFSSKTVQRMNDRSLVEELVAYLIKGGVTEKRKAVEELLESEIDEHDIDTITQKFHHIMEKMCVLNRIKPLNSTRFKQRNDFYTLFCFVAKHEELSIEVLKEQYNYLVFIDDNNYIRPTNEYCKTFKEYAYHCVTQSNSKNARQVRLQILEDVLLCNSLELKTPRFVDVCEYIEDELGIEEMQYKEIDGWYIVDVIHN